MIQLSRVRDAAAQLPTMVRSVDVLRRSGMVPVTRPDHALRSLIAVRRLGPVAGAAKAAALRDGRAVALIDELGPLTYQQLDTRSNALARAFADRGLGPGSVIALLARDHRGAVDTMVAAGKLGARLLLMNTGFAKPQLVDVARREQVSAIVHDEEFTDLVAALDGNLGDLPRIIAWVAEGTHDSALPTLDELITSTSDRPVPAPPNPGGMVLLTSGTTGTPKGAPRTVRSPLAAAQFLDRIPLRAREATMLAAPLFHGTGLSQFLLTFALGSTVVLRRKFDPAETLRAVQDNKVTALVLVPTMLRRILDLGRRGRPVRHLVASDRLLRGLGPAARTGQPRDRGVRRRRLQPLRLDGGRGRDGRHPAGLARRTGHRRPRAGRLPRGDLRRERAGDHRAERHRAACSWAACSASRATPTAGTRRSSTACCPAVTSVTSTTQGRLFIDGRDDDMIVSGGENVFPGEVENLLLEHDGVVEAAVTGVPDDEFGQRLKAYLVPRSGATLDVEEIKAYVKANLARYKVPRDVVFLDELPRNATGKLLRDRLIELG